MNRCVCIDCSSVIFLRKQKRELLGAEAMNFQGIGRQLLMGLTETYLHKDFMVLAGNAFNGGAAALVLFSVFATVDFEDLIWDSPPAEGVQVPRRARAGLHAAIEVAGQRDY